MVSKKNFSCSEKKNDGTIRGKEMSIVDTSDTNAGLDELGLGGEGKKSICFDRSRPGLVEIDCRPCQDSESKQIMRKQVQSTSNSIDLSQNDGTIPSKELINVDCTRERIEQQQSNPSLPLSHQDISTKKFKQPHLKPDNQILSCDDDSAMAEISTGRMSKLLEQELFPTLESFKVVEKQVDSYDKTERRIIDISTSNTFSQNQDIDQKSQFRKRGAFLSQIGVKPHNTECPLSNSKNVINQNTKQDSNERSALLNKSYLEDSDFAQLNTTEVLFNAGTNHESDVPKKNQVVCADATRLDSQSPRFTSSESRQMNHLVIAQGSPNTEKKSVLATEKTQVLKRKWEGNEQEHLSLPTREYESQTSLSLKVSEKDRKSFVKLPYPIHQENQTKIQESSEDVGPKHNSLLDMSMKCHTGSQVKQKVLLDLEPQGMFKNGFVDCTDVREIASRIASMVSSEIRSGVWVSISPHMNRSILQAHEIKIALYSAAEGVEKLALEVITPTIVSAGIGKNFLSSCNDYLQSERVSIAILIIIREVLVVNASKVFLIQSGTSYSNDNSTMHETCEEEFIFRSHSLATSLIVSVAKKFEPQYNITEKLMAILWKHDKADEEFASCLKQVNGSHLGVNARGKSLCKEENVAWRINFNRNRGIHPLIRHQDKKDTSTMIPQLAKKVRDNAKSSFLFPLPNACFVTVVQKGTIANAMKKEKEQDLDIEIGETNFFRDHRQRMEKIKTKYQSSA